MVSEMEDVRVAEEPDAVEPMLTVPLMIGVVQVVDDRIGRLSRDRLSMILFVELLKSMERKIRNTWFC